MNVFGSLGDKLPGTESDALKSWAVRHRDSFTVTSSDDESDSDSDDASDSSREARLHADRVRIINDPNNYFDISSEDSDEEKQAEMPVRKEGEPAQKKQKVQMLLG